MTEAQKNLKIPEEEKWFKEFRKEIQVKLGLTWKDWVWLWDKICFILPRLGYHKPPKLDEGLLLTPGEIVKKEVARQAEFGMEPGWEDFVIAGIEEAKAQLAKFQKHKLARPDRKKLLIELCGVANCKKCVVTEGRCHWIEGCADTILAFIELPEKPPVLEDEK